MTRVEELKETLDLLIKKAQESEEFALKNYVKIQNIVTELELLGKDLHE